MVKDQVAAIDVDWLKWWMAEALVYAGQPYITSELPSAKVGVCMIVLCFLCCTSCLGKAK
jgi:hypothetical protein